MEQPSGIEALRVAVGLLGGPTAAAKAIGKSQSTVSEMLSQGKKVPAEWCIPLERATLAAAQERGSGDVIMRHQLRPDLWPDDADSEVDAAQ